MKKNEIIELEITDIGVNGEGIGRYDGLAFFVKDALAGDRVRAVITKLNKGYGFAKMLELIEASPNRVKAPCPSAARCGGCQIMELDYREQLRIKEEKVRNDLTRIGKVQDLNLKPVIGMDSPCPLHFRNKMQFPVGRAKDGRVIMGFYAGRTHCVIEAESCPVSAEGSDNVLKAIRRFIEENSISVYDEESGKGLIRHVLIRVGTHSGQIMVCLVINGDTLGKGSSGRSLDKLFAEEISGKFPHCSSICLNINKEKTNVILGNKVRMLFGEDYIEDNIKDLTFRISPLSFFQINSVQTEKLYSKALEYAKLTGKETVWDLYCGIGTISLFLARQAGKVYGVEIVPAAIENAKENALRNHIDNAEFFCGESEKIFPELCRREGFKADVVVVDPPRRGCGQELLDAILEVEPERIVYVSCNSATLARDIAVLGEKYRLEEATPVDMFPHTVHVETVCLLSNRKRKPDSYVKVSLDMEDYYRIKDGKEPKSEEEK